MNDGTVNANGSKQNRGSTGLQINVISVYLHQITDHWSLFALAPSLVSELGEPVIAHINGHIW